MHTRHEVWRYSKSNKQWIRDVYTNLEDAQRRYTRLKAKGKKIKPPQPVGTGISLIDRLSQPRQRAYIAISALFALALSGVVLVALFHTA